MFRNLLLAREHWEKAAILNGESILTYGDLAQKAFGLRPRLPVEAGTHVAILLPNGGDYVAALFGALMAGMTVLPLHTALTHHEVAALLARASVSTVISTEGFRHLFARAEDRVNVVCMETVAPWGAGEPPRPVRVDPNSPMMLMSTSGTAGKAKIVMLSQRNLECCVQDYLEKMNFEAFDEKDIRLVLCTPFSSAYGLFILGSMAVKGYAVVLVPERFTLDAFYRAVERYRVTLYEGGSAALLLLEQGIGRPIPYNIRSLRCFGFGGSGVSEKTLRNLLEAYPWTAYWQGYGMTEASPLITKVTRRAPVEKLASVGVAAKHLQLMIEAEGGRTQAPFVRGEIVIKGPSVMLGYYKDEAATAQAIRDGWLYTGDMGYLDEDGYLYLCGRVKSIILVRGFNVYPEEVEACILDSGLARDCVVYGEPDGFGSERVCADVIMKNADTGEEDIAAWCQERLADYKRPQRIRLTGCIRKTDTGKAKRGWYMDADVR